MRRADLQPLRRLIDDHVDDLGGLPQMLAQRHHVGVQAAEQESAVGLEPGDLGQVVRALLVELFVTAQVISLEGGIDRSRLSTSQRVNGTAR